MHLLTGLYSAAQPTAPNANAFVPGFMAGQGFTGTPVVSDYLFDGGFNIGTFTVSGLTASEGPNTGTFGVLLPPSYPDGFSRPTQLWGGGMDTPQWSTAHVKGPIVAVETTAMGKLVLNNDTGTPLELKDGLFIKFQYNMNS
jgi:hypothetical protein